MLKLLLISVWCATISLAAVYAGATWGSPPAPQEATFPILNEHHVVNSGIVTAPVLKDGAVNGYVVVEVTLTANDQPWHHRDFPDAELTDQLLATLQSGFPLPTDEDFTLDLIRDTLVEKMNARMGVKSYYRTLVTKLDYLSLDDMERLRNPANAPMKVTPLIAKDRLDVVPTSAKN